MHFGLYIQPSAWAVILLIIATLFFWVAKRNKNNAPTSLYRVVAIVTATVGLAFVAYLVHFYFSW
jgi:hypothetical protein